MDLSSRMATLRLPGTVLRSSGAWPCTSALGLRTRRYSALRSKLSPLSKAMVSVLRSLCSRSSVGHGCETSFMGPPVSIDGAEDSGRRPEGHTANRRSIARFAVPERRDGLPFRRRIDVEIDHADAALLEDGDALFQRRFHIGGLGHRADADRALRLGELGDVGRGVFHAQPDPAVLGLPPARARDRVLMQLVIEIGAIIVDQDQERNAMARGGPDRGRPHAEIAVAQHRDGVAALLVEPDRGADREAGSGAAAAAAVL